MLKSVKISCRLIFITVEKTHNKYICLVQKRKSNTDNQIYMKKRVLMYAIAIISTFALQSCVTNYVVSTPTQYKTSAKIEELETKYINSANKSAYSSLNVNFASVQKSELTAAITDVISHSKTIDDILNEASTYLGTPYRFGGMSRSGIDCSAFVLNVYNNATGISLPRVASAQAQLGERVDRHNLEKGDLVFFSHGGRISHVGIVEEVTADGEVKFIHAATSRGVMISSLNDSYWGPKFRFAKRIINTNNEKEGKEVVE